MANISLEGSIRTCKVDTAWANKIQSDRFLNPNLMVCPVWNGTDNAGRRVCADSFFTKRAGCNSADDRVTVENHLRPQYIEYVNLDANGIRGEMYGGVQQDVKLRTEALRDVHNITGQFGNVTGFQDWVYPRCDSYPYSSAMAAESERMRQAQFLQESFRANYNRHRSGDTGFGY